MLIGFWRMHVSERERELGIVTTKMDSLTALWNSNNVPSGSRAVTLVVSEDSKFAQAFAGDPGVITWTHEGFATATEAQMTREIFGKTCRTNHQRARTPAFGGARPWNWDPGGEKSLFYCH